METNLSSIQLTEICSVVLCDLADKLTQKQTDTGEKMTSLASAEETIDDLQICMPTLNSEHLHLQMENRPLG